jgi:hypothetical protein
MMIFIIFKVEKHNIFKCPTIDDFIFMFPQFIELVKNNNHIFNVNDTKPNNAVLFNNNPEFQIHSNEKDVEVEEKPNYTLSDLEEFISTNNTSSVVVPKIRVSSILSTDNVNSFFSSSSSSLNSLETRSASSGDFFNSKEKKERTSEYKFECSFCKNGVNGFELIFKLLITLFLII